MKSKRLWVRVIGWLGGWFGATMLDPQQLKWIERAIAGDVAIGRTRGRVSIRQWPGVIVEWCLSAARPKS
jgi:hypothetical protein